MDVRQGREPTHLGTGLQPVRDEEGMRDDLAAGWRERIEATTQPKEPPRGGPPAQLRGKTRLMASACHQEPGLEDGLILDDFEQFREFHSQNVEETTSNYNASMIAVERGGAAPGILDGAPVAYRRFSLVALPHDRPHPATQVLGPVRRLQREVETLGV